MSISFYTDEFVYTENDDGLGAGQQLVVGHPGVVQYGGNQFRL